MTVVVPVPFTFGLSGFFAGCRSWSEQASHLDDKGAVAETGRLRTGLGVVVVRVHDEQLAAGRIFPSEAQIAARRGRRRVVLDDAADEHAWSDRVGRPRAKDGRREGRLRKFTDTVGSNETRGVISIRAELTEIDCCVPP